MRLDMLIATIFLSTTLYVDAVEHRWSGVVEASAVNTKSIDSYLGGDYGKFGYDDGSTLSLSQVGINYQVDWNEYVSSHVIANGYLGTDNNAVGLSEVYLKYQGLPNEFGYRYQVKAGLFYPEISVDNQATAWSSPNTLNFSTINTWVGEELRHTGVQFQVTRLGKFFQSHSDVSANVTFFANNDTAGAMLSWHGWTASNRQTLLQEKLSVQAFPARITGMLVEQAAQSDPFIELDDRLGMQVNVKWRYKGNGQILAGFYHNNADTRVVIDGQYAWLTKFSYLGGQWKLTPKVKLLSQFMQGYTRMNAPTGMVVVENDFRSGYVMLVGHWRPHQLSFRVEEFSVVDSDNLPGDNNDEYGKAATLSYRYQWSKNWFGFIESNWINSRRQSRYYQHQPVTLNENQVQLAVKYYF